MFSSQLIIYGHGAELLKKYSRDKQGSGAVTFSVTDNKGQKHDIFLFDNYLQCYMVSALYGILHGKSVIEDPDRNIDAKIFPEMLMKNRRELDDIIQLMILSEEDKNIDKKIRNAFSVQRESDVEAELERKLTAYAKGGLYLIDEKFGKCKTYEDVANQIMIFNQELKGDK